MTETNSY